MPDDPIIDYPRASREALGQAVRYSAEAESPAQHLYALTQAVIALTHAVRSLDSAPVIRDA
jgi:hypothetical protein